MRKFNDRKDKIRKNVLIDLNEYYEDSERWGCVSTDLVSFAVFYHGACDMLLKAALLFDYKVENFANKFLVPLPPLSIDSDLFQSHHYQLLMEYAADRAVVNLLLHEKISSDVLDDARKYYYLHLNEFGYTNEYDLEREAGAETTLSTVVPISIFFKISNESRPASLELLGPELISSEVIWVKAWRFLWHAFHGDQASIEKSWKVLVQEWKGCFVRSNFHGFHYTYLVLVYFVLCQYTNTTFRIRDLAKAIA